MKEVSLWMGDGLDLESMDSFLQNPTYEIVTRLMGEGEKGKEEKGKGKEEEGNGQSVCASM